MVALYLAGALLLSSAATLAEVAAPAQEGTPLNSNADPATNLPSPWVYAGCYVENSSGRVLNKAFYYSSSMTGQSCVSFCDSKGFEFAGVEYGRECYCGLDKPATTVKTSECNMSCAGDPAQACGNSNRLTLYTNNGKYPATNPGTNGFGYVGCYDDDREARRLEYEFLPYDGKLSVANCLSKCAAGGYSIGGVEYSGECFCGSKLQNPAQLQCGIPEISGCNMLCSGNFSEFCGGSNRLNLYQTGVTTPAYCPPTTTTPTTTSSATPTATDIVYNGGFETPDGWTPVANPNGLKKGKIRYYPSVPDVNAHSGAAYFAMFYPSGNPSAKNSYCIYQTLTHPVAGTYKFSAYFGSPGTSKATDVWSVYVDKTQIGSGNVCNPGTAGQECTIKNSKGNLVYKSETLDLLVTTAQIGKHNLTICATFSAAATGKDYYDYFYLDDVSVLTPL